MKKRTSSMSRRIVSLLMSLVLTLTLVTPAAFATEVVGGSGTAIIEGDTNPADANTNEDAEGKDDENKDTEHGGDEQPTNPGDEDKNPARVRTMSTRLPMKPILRRAKALIPPWLPSAR